MSPLIRECEKRGLDYFILHTGQHYSYELDAIFFDQLELPKPRHNLNIGSGSHAEETGKMLIAIERLLLEEKPDIVLVEGDTNSVLAGALTAAKLHISLGHVEAGMRSYDRYMPEEINRIVTDHISDYLFAPTGNSKRILLFEGISEDKIFVTGSTIVEAINENVEIAMRKARPIINVEPFTYCLATIHRQENVDVPERLADILDGLEKLYKISGLAVILPVHPRTRKNLDSFGIDIPEGVRLIEPLGFLEFLYMERNARLILTDSGGVQMEACILHIPCVTLRSSTEWVETLEVGANVLSGTEPAAIVASAKQMLEKSNLWEQPLGDGTATVQTLDIIAGL